MLDSLETHGSASEHDTNSSTTEVQQTKVNVFEGITVEEEVLQLIVSTSGNTITARDITVKAKTTMSRRYVQ